MIFTTNVSKSSEQAATIIDVIKGRIGKDVIGSQAFNDLNEQVISWVEYLRAIEADCRLSSKAIHTTQGTARLTHNEGNGNIKIQIKKKSASANVPA